MPILMIVGGRRGGWLVGDVVGRDIAVALRGATGMKPESRGARECGVNDCRVGLYVKRPLVAGRVGCGAIVHLAELTRLTIRRGEARRRLGRTVRIRLVLSGIRCLMRKHIGMTGALLHVLVQVRGLRTAERVHGRRLRVSE